MNASRILVGVLAIAASALLVNAEEHERLKVTVGEQRILMTPKAPIHFFPDEPISVLSTKPLTVLMTCGKSTYRFVGNDWTTLLPQAEVLAPSGKDTFDQGYAGIGAVHRIGPTVFALYHAENFLGKHSAVSVARDQPAFFGGVGLAISTNAGVSFRKAGQVLSSGSPYQPGMECGGVGDPAMCLDRSGKYLLAYYGDFSRSHGKNVQTCHARCDLRDKAAAGKWFKYHNGEFAEPGLGGKETYVLSMYEAGADSFAPHVQYSKELDRYLMVFTLCVHGETDGTTFFTPVESGVYVTSSLDGVQWSEPVMAFRYAVLFIKGVPAVQHPTLHLTKATTKSVQGMLLYPYTPNSATTPHHLAGRDITVALSHGDKSTSGAGPCSLRMRLVSALKGTKWKNTNNAIFEWTADGRIIHNGVQKWWRAIDGQSVEVFFDDKKKATLTFDKELTHFDQPLGDGRKFEGSRIGIGGATPASPQ